MSERSSKHLALTVAEIDLHKKEALALLKNIDSFQCNIEDGAYTWEQVVEERKIALGEFLTWLETGNTKHIHVSDEDKERLYEHFK